MECRGFACVCQHIGFSTGMQGMSMCGRGKHLAGVWNFLQDLSSLCNMCLPVLFMSIIGERFSQLSPEALNSCVEAKDFVLQRPTITR